MSDELSKYREIAARAWCAPETGHIEMMPELAEEFAKILQRELAAAQAENAALREDAERIRELESGAIIVRPTGEGWEARRNGSSPFDANSWHVAVSFISAIDAARKEQP